MAAGTLLVLYASLSGAMIEAPGNLRYAQTMAFTTLILSQLFNVFNARSDEQSAFQGLFQNRSLWGAIGLSLAFQGAVIYVPFLQSAFSTVRLSCFDWFVCAAVASSVLWLRECSKIPVRAMAKRAAAKGGSLDMTSPRGDLRVKPPPLSSDLQKLLDHLDGNSLTIGDLEQALRWRGFAILILLMAIPFCIIPVPGLSTPFGIAIFLMGGRIACGRKPWLPGFIFKIEIPHPRLERLLKAGVGVVRRLEKVVKPRMHFIQNWPGMMHLIGVSIASGGLLLMLPLPFSNWLPAWAILFLTTGMMEKDGLLVLVGHCLTLISWGLVVLSWMVGAKGLEKLFNLF